MLYEHIFLYALLATVFSETAFLLILIKLVLKENIKIIDLIFVGTIASSLTLPYLWFVAPIFFNNSFIYAIVSEILIVFIESIIYYQFLKIRYSKLLLISLLANILSIIIGLIIF